MNNMIEIAEMRFWPQYCMNNDSFSKKINDEMRQLVNSSVKKQIKNRIKENRAMMEHVKAQFQYTKWVGWKKAQGFPHPTFIRMPQGDEQ